MNYRHRLERLVRQYPFCQWAGLAVTNSGGWRVFIEEVNGVHSGRRVVGWGRSPRAAFRDANRNWMKESTRRQLIHWAPNEPRK